MKTGEQRPGLTRRMTKEEINQCPIIKYQGHVEIIRSEEKLLTAVKQLRQESVLGFDTETKPSFKKGQYFNPSILQLAHQKGVYLFHLNSLGLPTALTTILKDPKIIKTGVALNFDVSSLQKLTHFSPNGFIDIGELAKNAGIKNHGLRGLAAVLLGARISKTAQRSNWAAQPLSPAQVKYAATDAWIGRKLYFKLQEVFGPIST